MEGSNALSPLQQVLEGMSQAMPAATAAAQQPPRLVVPQAAAVAPQQQSFFAKNWMKLLIVGLIVVAILVGIAMYRMNKTKQATPASPADQAETDRLFVQQQQQPRPVKRVRFEDEQQPEQDSYYHAEDYQDYHAEDLQPASSIQLTPEEAADPMFEPLPDPK